MVTLEIFFLALGLTVAESQKVQKQELKNIKNVKRFRDGMPKSMQTKYRYIGIMHESKGQHVGKTPCLRVQFSYDVIIHRAISFK